jgi:hypothetical protein
MDGSFVSLSGKTTLGRGAFLLANCIHGRDACACTDRGIEGKFQELTMENLLPWQAATNPTRFGLEVIAQRERDAVNRRSSASDGGWQTFL